MPVMDHFGGFRRADLDRQTARHMRPMLKIVTARRLTTSLSCCNRSTSRLRARKIHPF
jgi:hypothetical protein